MTTSIPDPGTRSHLVRALRTLASLRPRRALLEEAEIELWSMYRSEQVDLLLEAARLRADASDAMTTRSDAGAGCRELNAWRRQAIELVSACACDGYPIAPRLAECLVLPLPNWTAARDLAGEARRLRAGAGEEA